ncbi:MAG: PAS domain S-box protein [Armatimonadetes bacterium]|nr:PAS domain S-box protein [Armatimonadota bacterium]
MNDAVGSGAPCDPALQEVLALYGSLVGHVLAQTRRLEQTRVLARLAQRLAVATGIDELALVVREESLALFGWEAHYLAYQRPDEPGLRVLGSVEAGGTPLSFADPAWQPAGGSPAESCLLSGEALVVESAAGTVAWEPFDDTALRSRIYAPLRGEGGLFGLLTLQSRTRGRYRADDAALLARLADLVGPVLERIQTREALHTQGEHVRRITDAIPGAVFELRFGPKRTAEREVYVSRGVAGLLGRSAAELSAGEVRLSDLVVAEDRANLLASYQQAARSGAAWRCDFRVQVDGALRWIRGVAQGGAVDQQGARRWTGILLDVTSEKRAEARQRLLATVVEQATDAIIVTDADGAIEYVNPAFEKVTGYHRGEVLGRSPSLLKSGQHDAEFYRQLWETIQSRRPWSGQIVNKRKDGSLSTDETIISAVTDEAQQITNYVAVKRDVSGELRLQEQLRQAAKMEAIGHLAGGIAHDFNNLLTAIVGYNGMVMEQLAEGHPARDDAAQVHQAAEHAASLTRQLLTFARREMVEPQPIEVGEQLARLEQLLRRLLGSQLELLVDPGRQPLTVQADPGQLEQIVLNLAINARDAMPDGGRLSITAEPATVAESADQPLPLAAGAYVRLRFTDTGCGIAEEVRGHIFEPFFTTKPKGKGTGLGLATVYAIARQSGGHVECRSRLGEGSTFTVWLPRLDRPAAANTPLAEAPALPARVLLVEDERAVRTLTARALKNLGYEVHAACDAEEALTLADELDGEFDLLVADMIMPGMTGRVLADELTASYPGLRVLFISGYADTEVGHLALDQHRRAFLAKPFTARELATALAALRNG